jgi:hypothetical protein
MFAPAYVGRKRWAKPFDRSHDPPCFARTGQVFRVLSPSQKPGAPHPRFPVWLRGSLNFMRPSLKKGARAVVSRVAYRKFGASRSFFARCGIPQLSPSSLPRIPQLCRGAPCSHQRYPEFLLSRTSRNRVCGFLSKKAACSCSTPPNSTGNPGYVGRKRWRSPRQLLVQVATVCSSGAISEKIRP